MSAVPAESPSITVRPGTPADAPALGRLGALLVRTHHEFDPARFIAATPRTERGYASWLASQLAVPDVVVLVAERAGEVIGYAYAGVAGPDYMALRGPAGVVHDLVVDPAHRDPGVGRMLLEAVLNSSCVIRRMSRASVRASLPASTPRGANSGVWSSCANRVFQGHTSWEEWRYARIAIPLGTGTRTLPRARARAQ